MFRRLRWWTWALGAAFLLLLAVGFGLWVVARAYGPALTRERIERGLAAALDRPVRVGAVELEPWLARLAIEGVSIAAGPTGQGGAAIEVRRATVRLGISSIWRREIVLARIHVQDVAVDHTATGGGEPFALPAAIPDSIDLGPVRVVIQTVSVAGARIRYHDPGRQWVVEADGVEASARPVDRGLDVTLAAASVAATRPHLKEAVERLRVVARLRGDGLAIQRATVRWRGQDLSVTGELTDVDGTAGLALTARGNVPLDAVANLAGNGVALTGVAALDGTLQGSVSSPRVAARFTISELTAAGVAARRVTGRLAWSDGRLEIPALSAQALGGSMSGTLAMTPERPADSRLTLRLDRVELPALEKVAGRILGARGHLTAEGELRGDLRRIGDATGRFNLSSPDLVLPEPLARLGAGAVTLDARLGRRAVEILSGEARWRDLRASGVSGVLTAEGPARLRGALAGDVGRLARAWGEPRVAGQATVDAELGGRWTDLVAAGRTRAASLTVGDVSVGDVDVPFSFAGRTLTFTNARAALGPSRVEGSGTLGWTGPGDIDPAGVRQHLRLQADLAARDARLESLARWIPAEWRGTGRFSLTGRLDGTLESWRGHGSLAAGTLTVRGEAIEDLSARFSVSPAGLDVGEARARVGGVPVEGVGVWMATGDARATARLGPAALGRLPWTPAAVDVSGTARAEADLARRNGTVSGTVKVSVEGASLFGVALGRGALDGRLADGALTASAAFPDARVTGTASGRLEAGHDIAVRLTVAELGVAPLVRRLPLKRVEIRGAVSGVADLVVPVSRPAAGRGAARLDPVLLVVNGEEWRNEGPVVVQRLADSTRIDRAHFVSALGAVEASGSVHDAGRLELAGRGRIPLTALPALRPEIREASGTLAFSARVAGTASAPDVHGDGAIDGGRAVLRDLPVTVTGVRARFSLGPERLRIVDAVASVEGGEVRASGDVAFAEPAPRLDLKLAGRLPLSALAALRPEIREAAGFMDVAVSVSGTTAAPQAVGEGTVTGGRLALRDIPESLRNIHARFTMSPTALRLSRGVATFGGGEVSVAGDLGLTDGAIGQYRFTIGAREVPLNPVAGFQSTWNADLELVGVGGRRLLRGEARLVRGSYVSDTPLVQLLLDGERRSGGGGPEVVLPLDVRLALDDNLSVRTAVARFRAGGVVTVQGTTAAPVLFGAVEVREGQFIFRKQRFTIESAAARFTDPRRIDPIIDVRAISRIQSYDVTLVMTGRIADLEIRLASAPPLPEADVLSLVAFGSTREQLTRGGATAMAGQVAGLIVQDLFGFGVGGGLGPIDVVEVVESPDSEGRWLKVGKRLDDRTMVVYSQGIENTAQRRLRLEYTVVGPLVVAGEQDFRGGFGADVLLRLRFR